MKKVLPSTGKLGTTYPSEKLCFCPVILKGIPGVRYELEALAERGHC